MAVEIEKVRLLRIKKEKDKLYYVDKKGDVHCFDHKTREKEIVRYIGVQKEHGYCYFIDNEGDVSRFKPTGRHKKIENKENDRKSRREIQHNNDEQ